jgi:carboxyl-terminal processing protease
MDNEGFYPIIRKHDEVLKKALEVIRTGAADSVLHVDNAQASEVSKSIPETTEPNI